MSVKLISSWTQAGGSTRAHIALTNLLNHNGIDCTFYGPQDWHLDKCKGAFLSDATISPTDTLISHFIQVPPEAEVKKHILYCHEKDLFPLKDIPLAQYDLVVFVSNSQKKWHAVNHPSVIIPPVVDTLKWKNPNNGVAGVIGSIDYNKQTHKSIRRALKDGYNKVLLFGDVTDMPYFNRSVANFINAGKAALPGHQDDREAMYGEISHVYHTSLSETFGLVEAECRLAGIPYNGPSYDPNILEDKEIFRRWEKIINYQ